MERFKGRFKSTHTPNERFFDKVHFEPTSGCWLWGGSGSHGYGTFWVDGKMLCAHRVSYTLHRGEIPAGMELDHLCRNGMCVNPEHLEAVTHRENVLRGVGTSAANARKSFCKYGHEFNEDNTLVNPRGGRQCRQCTRDSQVRSYHQRRAATLGEKEKKAND